MCKQLRHCGWQSESGHEAHGTSDQRMQSTVYGRVNTTRDVFITMARSRLAERLSEFIKEQRQYQSLTDETSPSLTMSAVSTGF